MRRYLYTYNHKITAWFIILTNWINLALKMSVGLKQISNSHNYNFIDVQFCRKLKAAAFVLFLVLMMTFAWTWNNAYMPLVLVYYWWLPESTYWTIIYLVVTYIYTCYIIVGHGDNRSLVARAHASYESSVSVLRTMPSEQSSRDAAYLEDIHVT